MGVDDLGGVNEVTAVDRRGGLNRQRRALLTMESKRRWPDGEKVSSQHAPRTKLPYSVWSSRRGGISAGAAVAMLRRSVGVGRSVGRGSRRAAG
jgi:hypothetical protein